METAEQELKGVVQYEIEQPVKELPHFRLLGNGHQMNCPFKTVTMIPTQSGQFGAITHSCTTECPLAEISHKDGGLIAFTISCGSKSIERIVSFKEEARIQPVKNGLISIS